jgi:hypothetical protein
MPLPGIEPRLLCRSDRSLVTIPTELSRLYLKTSVGLLSVECKHTSCDVNRQAGNGRNLVWNMNERAHTMYNPLLSFSVTLWPMGVNYLALGLRAVHIH